MPSLARTISSVLAWMASCNRGTGGRWSWKPYVDRLFKNCYYSLVVTVEGLNSNSSLQVFDDPFSKRKKLKPKLETIHVNDTVVVGEFNYKFLCIWSLKTKQVVRILKFKISSSSI